MLVEWYEINNLLHKDQMRSRQKRGAIDAVTRVFSRVQEAWEVWKLTDMLLMNVKGPFDNVSPSRLLHTMKRMQAGGDLMR